METCPLNIALRCRARAGFSRRSRENPTMCGLGPASRVKLNSVLVGQVGSTFWNTVIYVVRKVGKVKFAFQTERQNKNTIIHFTVALRARRVVNQKVQVLSILDSIFNLFMEITIKPN